MRPMMIIAVLVLICGCTDTPPKENTATSPEQVAITSTSLTQPTETTQPNQPAETPPTAPGVPGKSRKTSTTTVPEAATETTQPDPCMQKRKDIRNAIKLLNYCSADSECAVAELFGCYSLVNKGADASQVKRDAEAYLQSCLQPDLQCQEPPTTDNIKCEGGRCVESNQPATTDQTVPGKKKPRTSPPGIPTPPTETTPDTTATTEAPTETTVTSPTADETNQTTSTTT
jgi:hypothetical protein